LNPDGTKKWSFKTNGYVQSSPAIAMDGTIYVGSNDGKLYAIYPNGTKKWSLGIGDGWVTSSPVIDRDGIIFIGSVGGYNICAVNPNGTKKWNFVTGDSIYSSPTLDDEGTIYCGSHDGYIYALYPNGTLKWKYNTGTLCGGSGATVGEDGTLYFGTVEGSFYALYPNGTKKWKLELGINVVSSPAIAEDGTIYVAAYKDPFWGAYIYGINPDGSINWKYFIDTDSVSASPAIDKYGIIYIGGWDGFLYAFNPNGTLKWSFKALDYVLTSAAIGEDGTIYFGSDSESFTAYLYAIEPIDDNPPEIPDLDGPENGGINVDYTYTAETSDPDGDNVSYFFDWGDGSSSGWTEFVPSGESVTRRHRWKRSDTYTIRVKAIDEYGMESDWGTLTVTMPRNKASYNLLYLWFLERFPILQKILNYIL
jgi:outer membrane protein assembly factor BamB